MKPSSAAKKPISRALAKNAALVNQLATPGLGSLMGRRWLEGIGQLLISVAGFILVMAWFFREISGYLSQGFGDAPTSQAPGPGMLALGSGLFLLAWLWSAVTSLSLIKEASTARKETLEGLATSSVKSDEAAILAALAALPRWRRTDALIARTYEFKDFPQAMKFVNAVAEAAEEAWHHPDIDIRWNKVTLVLTTHDVGGLTELDLSLAKKCDALAKR
jgi:4a-hydroxytetrahydrobiopterin dehydratase